MSNDPEELETEEEESTPTSKPTPVEEPEVPDAPVGLDENAFKQLVDALEADYKAQEEAIKAKVARAKDAGEDTDTLKEMAQELNTLRRNNTDLLKTTAAQEAMLRNIALQQMEQEVKNMAQYYELDEKVLRREFGKTKKRPEDLELVAQRLAFAALKKGSAKADPNIPPPSRIYDGSGPSRGGRDVSKMSPEMKIREGFKELGLGDPRQT